MMKYRIRSKQCWTITKMLMGQHSETHARTKYYVQSKYNWLFFWLTTTSPFDKLSQAEEHIKLKLDEKESVG